MTPEGKVKEKITKILKSLGIYYFMPRGTSFGRAGIPDYICCVNGKFVGIEAKAGTNKLSALQELEISKINSAGGLTYVAYEHNIDNLKFILEHMVNASHR